MDRIRVVGEAQPVWHGADGNAGPLLLLAPGDHGRRHSQVPQRARHRMVSACSGQPGDRPGNTIRDPNLESQITWKNVEITPGATGGSSDGVGGRAITTRPARPTRRRSSVGSQQEKFLFYRGVGQFEPPLTAKFEANGTDPDREPRWRAHRRRHPLREPRRLDRISHHARRATEKRRLTRLCRRRPSHCFAASSSGFWLRGTCIRRKPRRWSRPGGIRGSRRARGSSTFRRHGEPSTRSCRCQINPAPIEVARVFVGRIELMTPRR